MVVLYAVWLRMAWSTSLESGVLGEEDVEDEDDDDDDDEDDDDDDDEDEDEDGDDR